ncbi:MAG: cyclic nucleotide-binding/CBS domain-containing protein [Candidatus Hydrothermarchaeales archaeon]
METSVRIKEAMSTNLVTARPDATAVKVARTMSENKVGSVIITENGDNEGIVTERDICYKVVGAGKDPKTVFAKDIMSTDLVTIPSEKTITDAAKKMVKKGIRRLAVTEEGKIKGIITASDILVISPNTIEVLRELYAICANPDEAIEAASDVITEGGICDECGTFTDNLTKVDGRYLCDDCREELEG